MKGNIGHFGEELAESFLKQKGYKILDRNFRIRGGEIDIIAKDKSTLVYVEVKTRTSNIFGLPEESVTKHKLKFIERAAKFYRQKNQNLPEAERIDVISIDISTQKPTIKHIKSVTS